MQPVSLPEFLEIIDYKFDEDILDNLCAIGDKTAIREKKGIKYRKNYERGLLLIALANKFGCKDFLEIGTGRGYVVACMYKMTSIRKIVTIDNSLPKNIDKLMFECGLDASEIKFIEKDANRMDFSDLNHYFDIFFIDGQHDGESISKNYKLCQDAAKENAIFVFDDYRNKFPSIKKTIDNIGLHNAYLVHTDGWFFNNDCIRAAKDADKVKEGKEYGSGMVVCFGEGFESIYTNSML